MARPLRLDHAGAVWHVTSRGNERLRAGISTTAGQWKWSNYRATAGLGPAPAWVETEWTLEQFSPRREAERRYRGFVAEGRALGMPRGRNWSRRSTWAARGFARESRRWFPRGHAAGRFRDSNGFPLVRGWRTSSLRRRTSSACGSATYTADARPPRAWPWRTWLVTRGP